MQKASLHTSPTFSDSAKEEQWHSMAKKIGASADKMGCPIDPDIEKTVIILNLLGYTTDNSCEGHVERGSRPYPFVRFISLDTTVETLHHQKNDLLKQIDNSTQDNPKKLNILQNKLDAIYNKIDTIELLELLPLNNLLTTFYKDHPINRNTMLAIRRNHLTPLDSTWQVYRDTNERSEKLRGYQEEIRQFTDFLIEHWNNQ